jgi:hypothetical protein
VVAASEAGGVVSAPRARIVDALSGDIAPLPSGFFRALSEADNFCRDNADAEQYRQALAAAVGFYCCGDCLTSFQFHEGATLEDYAALNRWLGRHERCGDES